MSSDARDKAMKYMTSRIRTVKEVKDFLERKMYSEEIIEDTINWLLQNKLLDDAIYAEHYIPYGLGKGKSIRKVNYELKQKGLSEQDIIKGRYAYEDQEDIQIRDTEFDRAFEVALKSMKDKDCDEKNIARVGRRLASLGYDTNIIYKVINRFQYY